MNINLQLHKASISKRVQQTTSPRN